MVYTDEPVTFGHWVTNESSHEVSIESVELVGNEGLTLADIRFTGPTDGMSGGAIRGFPPTMDDGTMLPGWEDATPPEDAVIPPDSSVVMYLTPSVPEGEAGHTERSRIHYIT